MDIKKELNEIFELNTSLSLSLAAGGVEALRHKRSKLCDQKYRHGTSEWAKCMRWKPRQENRQHYMDLCKRKYQGMPKQYQECRQAVSQRFQR